MKKAEWEYRNQIVDEMAARDFLYCRLIGGPCQGEIIEVRHEASCIDVPIYRPPDFGGFSLNPPTLGDMKKNIAHYHRSDSMPTEFHHVLNH
jgi:hypothetical protein